MIINNVNPRTLSLVWICFLLWLSLTIFKTLVFLFGFPGRNCRLEEPTSVQRHAVKDVKNDVSAVSSNGTISNEKYPHYFRPFLILSNLGLASLTCARHINHTRLHGLKYVYKDLKCSTIKTFTSPIFLILMLVHSSST